ncbi:MAG: sulfotransferase family protein [Alphaproteobacteria bacterium HGW-Alphaproteobacteria-16]|nr:MAG: sulfotransferase family protein [Alphaproteobacteria bacterium HGW-Alphaproteobacteria-16]
MIGAKPAIDLDQRVRSSGSTSGRDALLVKAKYLRSRQMPNDALEVLNRLEAHHPGFSRLYQERAHCHVILGDPRAAILSLNKAVELNPTLPASWDMLERLYRSVGDFTRADHAAQTRALLGQLPRPIVMANSLAADGDFEPAERILRDYLREDAGNVGALRLLARLCLKRQAPEDAEIILLQVLELEPGYHDARYDYASLLLLCQRHGEARRQAERLLRHASDNRDYLKLYGAACIGLGDHEPVIDLYASLLNGTCTNAPEIAELRLWRGNALKVTGRSHEAIVDYRASLAAVPDYGVAWFSLANLKTYRFSDDEIGQIRAAEAAPDVLPMDRVYLCFALGKAFEDRREYRESWAYYERGNAFRRQMSNYRPETAEVCTGRLQRLLTAEFFAARADWGVRDAAPIFIVGLPRSGSTLIEQILASHPDIEGTQELTGIGRYMNEICGEAPSGGLPLDPAALGNLTANDARALGQRFLSEARDYRRIGRPFFIDKMPNNFWHIGLIHMILPRSTIIDIRREPMACCFSNLKQLFGTSNQEFTYGMDEIASYYRCYLDLMRHWDAVLPGRVLRVGYEDVVDNLAGTTRAILGHIGLPFEPACLSFHENTRSVRTPSAEQVRQPISRDGLDQWSHYARWLDPLRDSLGDALTAYRN